ncbi:MAG: DUF4010 domain-containing protein [Parvibaculaceae bacterium]|nr:DUF4010 domain-containing protein [Parvibaculaceae bacterium]
MDSDAFANLTHLLAPERGALLIALSFFFGLGFEESFAHSRLKPPGGIRTFPLLAICGGLLYALEPVHAFLFAVGLAALALWLGLYYWKRLALNLAESAEGADRLEAGIMAPACNLLAFILGPLCLVAPLWIPIAAAVAGVLFLGERDRLHTLAARTSSHELVTLAKFLIVIGVVLPLVPDEPVTRFSVLTPYLVWLAVVAVSTVSYASYLLQRYVAPSTGSLISACLGGLYSSTATTVVLSRRLGTMARPDRRTQSAIVIATAVMFLRIGVVVAIFNISLALHLAPWLAGLSMTGFALAALIDLTGGKGEATATTAPVTETPQNPLELNTAFVFAVLFVGVSVGVELARQYWGSAGLYVLAAVSGFTDVDPFVLNVSQDSAGALGAPLASAAILISASANNLLKGGYALAFAGRMEGLKPALALFALTLAGLAIAFLSLPG